MTPLSRSPPVRLARSTALMSASLDVDGALGLPSAAFIAGQFDWHVLFWISAALGAVALTLVVTVVPESRVRTGGRFDLIGSLGLSAALVSLLLAISNGADWGWTSPATLGLFATAVVVLLVWGWYELRTTQPLVDLRTTARRQVLFTNLASVTLGFSMFALSLVTPQLLQLPAETGYGLGRSMLIVGLVMDGHRRRFGAARAGPRLVPPPKRRRGTGARGRAGRGREGLPPRVTPHPADCARCEQFFLCSGLDPRGGHRE